MLQSAAMTCDFLRLKKGDKALLCLPLEYIAGKMMVVRAVYAGLDLRPVEPSGNPMAEITQGIDFAAMVPLQVYNSLQTEEGKKRISQIKKLIIGGGAMDERPEELLRDFPHEVYSTYGMTETVSHIAIRRLSGHAADSYYTPLPGVFLKLSGDQTLVIDAPHVADETLYTNDIAEIRADGSFRVLGRKDNVINSGGVKIQIEEVERVLHPYMSANFAVTSVPHPKLGEAAALLIESGTDAEHIRQVIESRLPRFQRPLHIFRVEAIPQTGNGKTDRAAAKEMAAERISHSVLRQG